MNKYEFQHVAKCPNGVLNDTYSVVLESERTIQVESILKCLKDAPDPTYQEDLADFLRNTLAAKTTVTGFHFGVRVTCIRE